MRRNPESNQVSPSKSRDIGKRKEAPSRAPLLNNDVLQLSRLPNGTLPDCYTDYGCWLRLFVEPSLGNLHFLLYRDDPAEIRHARRFRFH